MMNFPQTQTYYGQPAQTYPNPGVGGQTFPWANYQPQTQVAPSAPIHGPAGTVVNLNGQPYQIPGYVARNPNAGHDQYPVQALMQLPGFDINIHNYHIAVKNAQARGLPAPNPSWFVNGQMPAQYAPAGAGYQPQQQVVQQHSYNSYQQQPTQQPVQFMNNGAYQAPVAPANQPAWVAMVPSAMNELAKIINQTAMAYPNVVNRQLAEMLINGQNQQPWYKSFVAVLAGASYRDAIANGRPPQVNPQYVQIVFNGMNADLINKQPNIVHTLPANVVQGIQSSIDNYNRLAMDTKAWMQSLTAPVTNTGWTGSNVNMNNGYNNSYGNFNQFTKPADDRPAELKNNLFTGSNGRYVEPPVGNLAVDAVYDANDKPVMSKWALMNAVQSGDTSYFGGSNAPAAQQQPAQQSSGPTVPLFDAPTGVTTSETIKPAYAYSPADFSTPAPTPAPADTGYQTSIPYEPTREERLNQVEGYGKKSPFPAFGYKHQQPDYNDPDEEEFAEPRVYGSDNDVDIDSIYDNAVDVEEPTNYSDWLLTQGELVPFGQPSTPVVENKTTTVTIEEKPVTTQTETKVERKRSKVILPAYNYRKQLLACRKNTKAKEVIVIEKDEKVEYKDHILPSSEKDDVLLSSTPNLFASINALESSYADQVVDNLGLVSNTIEDLVTAIKDADEGLIEVDDLIKSVASIKVNTPVIVTNDTDYSSDVNLVINKELESEVDLEDTTVHYTRALASLYHLSAADANLVKSIQRAKTASSVASRIEEFNSEAAIPMRQVYKLHAEATKIVNEQLKIVFEDEWEIDSLTEDFNAVYEEVAANYPDKLDVLNAIWVSAANKVYSILTKTSYSEYNEEELEAIGLTSDAVTLDGVTTIIRQESVTLLPVLYTDFPLAIDGTVGYIDQDVFPTIHGLLEDLAEANKGKNLVRLSLVYKDNTVVNIVQSVEDKRYYIVRA